MDSLYELGTFIHSTITDNKSMPNKICSAALPFINFYGPFNEISNIVSQATLTSSAALEGYRNFTIVRANYSSNSSYCYDAILGVTNIGLAVLGVVNYRVSLCVSSFKDTAVSLIDVYTHLNNANEVKYQEAAQSFYSAVNHGLRFALLIHPAGLELQVLSVGMQILSEVGNSYKEWQNEGRYLEIFSNLLLVGTRVYKLTPQLVELREKWLPVHSNLELSHLIPGKKAEDQVEEKPKDPIPSHQKEIDDQLENDPAYCYEDEDGEDPVPYNQTEPGLMANPCSGRIKKKDRIAKPKSSHGIIVDETWRNVYLPIRNILSDLLSKAEVQEHPNLCTAIRKYIEIYDRIPSRTVSISELESAFENLTLQAQLADLQHAINNLN